MNKMIPEITEMKIEDLGYGIFFESNRKRLKLGGFSVARVIVEHKGSYKVQNTSGEYLAEITGKCIAGLEVRQNCPLIM